LNETKSKSCLLVFIGMVLGALTMISLIVFLVIIIIMGFSKNNIIIKNNTWLVLDFPGDIVEKSFTKVPDMFGGNRDKIELYNYLNAIHKAAGDDRITGIIINGDLTFYSRAHSEEIGSALLKFKESGKEIVAWFSNGINRNYHLCLFADKIYMPDTDSAGLTINGFSQILPYYKDALDRIGIEFNVIHIGNYKGSGENYVRNSMSEELRESYDSVLNSLYNQFLKEIKKNRKIEESKIASLIENGSTLMMTPSSAKEYGFIDDLMTYTELCDHLSFNRPFNTISIYDYISVIKKNTNQNKIAIIYAEGIINNYYSGETKLQGDIVGAKTFIYDINKIKKDNNIKAVIIRINSPGGSALASELILKAIKDLQKSKPVYVSMGPIAASGGYYIACSGEKIFASPSTITGSIGVVSLLMNYNKLTDNIGIKFETIKKHKYDDFLSSNRKPTQEEIELLKKSMKNIYKEFTKHVMDERKINEENINSIAEGRIWTGTQAVKNKLVDLLGNLIDVIDFAAEKNNLDTYTIESYPTPPNFFDRLSEVNRIELDLLKDENIKKILNIYNYYLENGRNPSYLLPYYDIP